MLSSNKYFLACFIIFCCLWITKPLWAYEQQEFNIYNFSRKNIFSTNTCSKNIKKISPFDSKQIVFKDKKCHVLVSYKADMKHIACEADLNDKKDLFVTGNILELKCQTRAERMPKEF